LAALIKLMYYMDLDNPVNWDKNMNILDQYVNKEPSKQNVLDIFSGEWSSVMPIESELFTKPGTALLFDDQRIKWARDVFGGFENFIILELGPLEGGHSYMLQRMNAKKIISIEANTRAFLKCLCIKEIFNLDCVKFKLGDFIQFLEKTNSKFDLVFASGVLYHMLEPIKLLDLISKVTDRCFLWTHYYDKNLIDENKNIKYRFKKLEVFEYKDSHYEVSKYSYEDALNWLGFCGGANPTCKWLSRKSIIDGLLNFGYKDITIGFEQPNHPNGPAFAICAKR
jgi:hypothetical protein